MFAEAGSKEKHGVWDRMQELTICSLQNRLQHIYHRQPYARVDLNPMPELTLSPSKGLRIWPQSTVYTKGDAGREQCKGYSCLREAPQVRTKKSQNRYKNRRKSRNFTNDSFLNKSDISDENCTLHFFTSKAPLPYSVCPPNIKCFIF